MAFVWTLYVVTLVVAMKEPKRSGLDELRRREEESEELSRAKSMLKVSNNDSDGLEIQINASDKDSNGTSNTKGVKYCIKYINRATIICMAMIYMKRISLESVVGSTSVITKNRYGWSVKNVVSFRL